MASHSPYLTFLTGNEEKGSAIVLLVDRGWQEEMEEVMVRPHQSRAGMPVLHSSNKQPHLAVRAAFWGCLGCLCAGDWAWQDQIPNRVLRCPVLDAAGGRGRAGKPSMG